tara:strand:- start:545 stop:850 length:306 start_codon:yes stop_codon:yes gene_type:complete
MKKIDEISQKYNIKDLEKQIKNHEFNDEIIIVTNIDNLEDLENLAIDLKKSEIIKIFNNIEIENNIKINNEHIPNKTENLNFALFGTPLKYPKKLNAYIIF